MAMNAKHKFREGWIMLLRPFKFAELKNPLQKMTVLYAYSEKPIIDMELSPQGEEELDTLSQYWDKGGAGGIFNAHAMYTKRFGESDEDYNIRMGRYLDEIFSKYRTTEVYKGEVVQCYVEGQLCRFYPEEYKVISRETFDHLLTCPDEEYKIEIENDEYFNIKSIKDRIFYIRSRGINKSMAQKMSTAEAKDSVIFRPQECILEMFCREHEIY